MGFFALSFPSTILYSETQKLYLGIVLQDLYRCLMVGQQDKAGARIHPARRAEQDRSPGISCPETEQENLVPEVVPLAGG